MKLICICYQNVLSYVNNKRCINQHYCFYPTLFCFKENSKPIISIYSFYFLEKGQKNTQRINMVFFILFFIINFNKFHIYRKVI